MKVHILQYEKEHEVKSLEHAQKYFYDFAVMRGLMPGISVMYAKVYDESNTYVNALKLSGEGVDTYKVIATGLEKI